MWHEEYPYNAKGYLDSEHVEDLLKFLHDQIPSSGKEVVVTMIYDSEYDGLQVTAFNRI